MTQPADPTVNMQGPQYESATQDGDAAEAEIPKEVRAKMEAEKLFSEIVPQDTEALRIILTNTGNRSLYFAHTTLRDFSLRTKSSNKDVSLHYQYGSTFTDFKTERYEVPVYTEDSLWHLADPASLFENRTKSKHAVLIVDSMSDAPKDATQDKWEGAGKVDVLFIKDTPGRITADPGRAAGQEKALKKWGQFVQAHRGSLKVITVPPTRYSDKALTDDEKYTALKQMGEALKEFINNN